MARDIIGIECGACGEEAFQLVEREILKKVKVCPRCARRIDAEQENLIEAEALKGMGKAERLRLKKEKSHDWAHIWHGKHVILTHVEIVYGTFGYGKPKITKKKIRGIAYYNSKNDDRGWGRVKVVLDDAELNRIKYIKDNQKGKYKLPTIDGERFGVSSHLLTHGYYYDDPKFKLEEPVAICINWGERNELILEEVDETAERLEAQHFENYQR